MFKKTPLLVQNNMFALRLMIITFLQYKSIPLKI